MEMIKNKVVDKTWGNETWIVNNELYCSKILKLEQDKFCSVHYHIKKDETFCVLAGCIMLEICEQPWIDVIDFIRRKKVKSLSEGETVRIRPGVLHRFTGVEKISLILETSTQHFDEDSYRCIPSCVDEKKEQEKR